MTELPAKSGVVVSIGPSSQRIDKWLFFSRLVKSRSLAAKMVGGGDVFINGEKTTQPSKTIKPGDVITVSRHTHTVVARVLHCGVRRGPATEAQMLYEDQSPPAAPKALSALDRLVPVRPVGSGRPTKRERRETDRLRGT